MHIDHKAINENADVISQLLVLSLPLLIEVTSCVDKFIGSLVVNSQGCVVVIIADTHMLLGLIYAAHISLYLLLSICMFTFCLSQFRN